MSALKDQLLSPNVRPQLVEDCCRLIDEEVKRKSGVSGIAIKGAYKLVKGVKPGFVPSVVNGLMDDWMAKLEPTLTSWDEAQRNPELPSYLKARSGAVAEALLTVTDDRAAKNSGAVVKAYRKLRPTAKKHVEEAIPGLGQVVQRHCGGAHAQAS